MPVIVFIFKINHFRSLFVLLLNLFFLSFTIFDNVITFTLLVTLTHCTFFISNNKSARGGCTLLTGCMHGFMQLRGIIRTHSILYIRNSYIFNFYNSIFFSSPKRKVRKTYTNLAYGQAQSTEFRVPKIKALDTSRVCPYVEYKVKNIICFFLSTKKQQFTKYKNNIDIKNILLIYSIIYYISTEVAGLTYTISHN